jgi:adenine phosphoribosyltransferase
MDFRTHIRDVADFPKPGILFRDISPLLASPEAFKAVSLAFASHWRGRIDMIAALDARGFIFGGTLAHELGIPLVMVRKKGKLPGPTHAIDYDLEYGSSSIEVPADAISGGSRVLVIDDLLATGGTAAAARALIERSGGQIAGYAFVIELQDLMGRAKLGSAEVQSLVIYP